MPPAPRRALLAALVVALLIAGAASAASGQATPNSSGSTTLAVQIQPDGDARWTVSTTVPIRNESDRDAFRDLAESFERGDDVGFSASVFRSAASEASASTGRQMAIRDVERNATIIEGTDGNATGRLALEFTWTNFARVDGDRLHVDDAFNTTTGTWLPGLARGQTLVIEPPGGYGVVSAPPLGIQDGVVRLEGPRTFEPGYLSITYERGANGTPLADLLPVGGALALLVVGVVAYVWSRRSSQGGPAPAGVGGGEPAARSTDPREADPGTGAGTGTETPDPNASEVGAGAGAGAGAATDAPGEESEEEGDETEDEDDLDEELLSDEERVERLLERNGGRMKQARIVKETGWSNAKVSQLLSAMAEEDRVDKLRIGRENLISLPDEDIGETE